MRTAQATTGITGELLLHGIDSASPVAFERSWASTFEVGEPATIKEAPLSRLLADNNYSMIALRAINNGNDPATIAQYGSIHAKKARLIRVGGKEYRQIGYRYQVVKI